MHKNWAHFQRSVCDGKVFCVAGETNIDDTTGFYCQVCYFFHQIKINLVVLKKVIFCLIKVDIRSENVRGGMILLFLLPMLAKMCVQRQGYDYFLLLLYYRVMG